MGISSCWEPTMYKCYNQLFLLDFGPFRGILGPPTQLILSAASKRQVQLCLFMSSKCSLPHAFNLGSLNCTSIFTICRRISCGLTIFLSRIGDKHGFFLNKIFKLSRSWGCSSYNVCNFHRNLSLWPDVQAHHALPHFMTCCRDNYRKTLQSS